MNRKNSAFLLSLALILSSLAPAAPALAAEFESAPARLGAPVLPVIAVPDLPSAPQLNLALDPALAAPQLPAVAVLQAPVAASAAVAVPAQAAAARQASPTSLYGRLSAAVAGKISWLRAFDGAGAYGIRPLPKPVMPQGGSIELGDAPGAPPAGHGKQVTLNNFDIPGTRSVGSGSIFEAGPRVLDVAPAEGTEAVENSVKQALLKLVDADAARYGVTSADLETVHVKLVKGEGSQADTVYAYFRQQKTIRNVDGTSQAVRVNGSYLSFTVKFIKGKTVLMAAMAQLYPDLGVAANATITDAQAKAKAEGQLPQDAGLQLVFVERKIIFHDGRWRAVNLYDIEGAPIAIGVNVAVDLNDGEVFAWDSRMGALAPSTQTPATQTGRFILRYHGFRPPSAEQLVAIQSMLREAGLTIIDSSSWMFLVEGDAAKAAQIAKDLSTKDYGSWTSTPYNPDALQAPASAKNDAADPLALKTGLSQAQAALQVKDGTLFEVTMNLLNKSNIRAYRFYSASENAVFSALVDFQGHVTVRRYMPLSDVDYSAISLDKILAADKALAIAKDQGVDAVQFHIARRQTAVGPHPVEYTIADAAGKQVVFVADLLKEAHILPARLPISGDITGTITGRAEENDHRPGNVITVKEQGLPHITVSIGGKNVDADVDGNYSASASGSVDGKAVLTGLWAKVIDQQHNDLSVSGTLKPGERTPLVFNPDGVAELNVDQVNAYLWVTKIHDWWSKRLQGDKRIDQQIPININIDDECNAYYTPGTPSLNFFRSSANCSDTGRPGVVAHEYGHSVDDAIGGITNGGMSEGWGDIGSMFLLNTPIIGEGFLKNQTPSWIRNGENNYQYNASDEVHDQGQAWMGFAWKLRKSLIASLGEAAGTAEAESLIIPTLFAKAADIPSQMAQVLLGAMDKDGKIRHEQEIRAAAKAHGIDLPRNPGLVARLWNGLVSAMSGVEVEKVSTKAFATVPRGAAALGNNIVATDFATAPQDAASKAFLRVASGSFNRDQVRAFIQNAYRYRSSEYADLKMAPVTEVAGLFGTQFVVELSGSHKSVDYMMTQLQRLSEGAQAVPAQASSIKAPTGPLRLARNTDSGFAQYAGELKIKGGRDEREDSAGVKHSATLAEAAKALEFTIEEPVADSALVRVVFLSVNLATGKAGGSVALKNPSGGPAPESLRLLSEADATAKVAAEIAGWRSYWRGA